MTAALTAMSAMRQQQQQPEGRLVVDQLPSLNLPAKTEQRPALARGDPAGLGTAAGVKRQSSEVGREVARLAATTDAKHRAKMTAQAWGVDETFGVFTLLAGAYFLFRVLV